MKQNVSMMGMRRWAMQMCMRRFSIACGCRRM